jgi:hypothetical protein
MFQKMVSLILAVTFCNVQIILGQHNEPKENVYVDESGVMRWELNDEEVKGFGVNYSVPFAHAYRTAIRMGIDVKKAIDNDVYHFTRLGFDLYRLHVWDTEISDVEGNLLENEHLDAFDYLLKRLKDHNINYVITPIAFWGNGWPEPDTESPGFSNKYGKDNCLTNEDAINAQQNYLFQFLEHVNPYTGKAYKDDPNVIAFEVSNEPHHRGKAEDITNFVKGMVASMRKTGTKKPIFYNMSHGVHFVDDYFKGNVQGGTFQWYPTGLGYQRELSGNMLPNVSNYEIPFESSFKKHKAAKLVYEFDAADIGRSYIYPAMARSFRTAGIQIATHFAYDPTYMAYANTEYNTHYMNLAYTPQKALSLKISSEVFHEVSMYSEFGTYPSNNTFGNFKVNYEDDLAEYNSADKFFYTNSTASIPVNENELKEIAGYGNSALVNYEGTGAYFLDKIDYGVWRLEVMPDAIWVDNPFGRNSPNKTVAVINWKQHRMTLDLKDLGSIFVIEAINENNDFKPRSENSSFMISPGTYIVSRKGISKNWSANDVFKTGELNDFYAPESTVSKPWFKHDIISEISENEEVRLKIQFVAPQEPQQIQVVGYSNSGRFVSEMINTGGYNYSATIPSKNVHVGFLNYHIIVKLNADKYLTYPAAREGKSSEWDFFDRNTYKIKVTPSSYPVHLFNAAEDTDLLVRKWRKEFKLTPTQIEGQAEYQINLDKIYHPDNENLNAEPIHDYSFKHFILDRIKGKHSALASKKNIVFHGRALNEKPCKLQIALVMNDGSSYGKVVEIRVAQKDYIIPIEDLRPVKTVTLPRPYPTFLPYYLEHDIDERFNINNIESIQFSIGPSLSKGELNEPHGIGLISLRLE